MLLFYYYYYSAAAIGENRAMIINYDVTSRLRV